MGPTPLARTRELARPARSDSGSHLLVDPPLGRSLGCLIGEGELEPDGSGPGGGGYRQVEESTQGSVSRWGKAGVLRVTTEPSAKAPTGIVRGSKVEQHVVDFGRLSAHADLFRVDCILCALGTTIRKAGSRERFREVDHDYPLAVARLGVKGGARHFLLVSAIGADPRSRVFYNRVKGEVEAAVSALPYRSLTLVRPSLLLGDRAEFRLGEEVMKRMAFLSPRKYKPVEARALAAALLQAAREDSPGRRTIESKEIPAVADAYFANLLRG